MEQTGIEVATNEELQIDSAYVIGAEETTAEDVQIFGWECSSVEVLGPRASNETPKSIQKQAGEPDLGGIFLAILTPFSSGAANTSMDVHVVNWCSVLKQVQG